MRRMTVQSGTVSAIIVQWVLPRASLSELRRWLNYRNASESQSFRILGGEKIRKFKYWTLLLTR
jgi:hypothetical protein